MGTIARTAKAGGGTNFNSGQTIDPAEVNTDFNTIVTEVNGLLDDGNIETATIPGAKSLRFTEISAPSSPSSNDLLVYGADDGAGVTRLHSKDSAGNVLALGYTRLVGTGTEAATVGGVIAGSFGSVGTPASTAETVLKSLSVAAAAITTNGEAVRLVASGLLAANANNKTIRVRLDGVGGTSVLDSGTIATNSAIWDVDLRIIRISATTADIVGVLRVSAAGGGIGAVSVHRMSGIATPTVTFASAWTVDVTGENGTANANDITCRSARLFYEPIS